MEFMTSAPLILATILISLQTLVSNMQFFSVAVAYAKCQTKAFHQVKYEHMKIKKAHFDGASYEILVEMAVSLNDIHPVCV